VVIRVQRRASRGCCILVAGSAGFTLAAAGYEPVVVDNLSNSALDSAG
jgi:hypothetical protein